MAKYQYCSKPEKLDTLDIIISKCSAQSVPALKSELYAFALERWGSEWRKFLEYLTDLVLLKRIVVDGEEVWTYKRWKKIEVARSKDYLKMKDLISSFSSS